MEGGDLHTWREDKQHWETVDIPYSTYWVRYVHLSLRKVQLQRALKVGKARLRISFNLRFGGRMPLFLHLFFLFTIDTYIHSFIHSFIR